MPRLEGTLTPVSKDPSLREAQVWDQFHNENPDLFRKDRVLYIHLGRQKVAETILAEFNGQGKSYLLSKGYDV